MRLDECHDLPSPPLYCYKSASASGAFYKLNTDTPLLLGGSDFPHRYLPSLDFSGKLSKTLGPSYLAKHKI